MIFAICVDVPKEWSVANNGVVPVDPTDRAMKRMFRATGGELDMKFFDRLSNELIQLWTQ